jgi:hypothetical protein
VFPEQGAKENIWTKTKGVTEAIWFILFTYTIGVIKSRRVRCTAHIARVEEMKNA